MERGGGADEDRAPLAGESRRQLEAREAGEEEGETVDRISDIVRTVVIGIERITTDSWRPAEKITESKHRISDVDDTISIGISVLK